MNKKNTSKFRRQNIEFKRVCYVGTIYSLLVYLSYSSLEEIRSTLFIVGKYVPKNISDKLDRCAKCIRINSDSIFTRRWYTAWLYWRLVKLFKIPSLKDKIIFANDHLDFSATLLGNHTYNLIEDSAYVCSRDFNGYRRRELEVCRNKKTYRIKRFLLGNTLYKQTGNNLQCIGILQTTNDFVPYMKGKNIMICNIGNKWKNFSDEKRSLIKDVYGLTAKDILQLKSKKIVLFTQPLYPDFISAEEHLRIYESIISHYDVNEILIKTHPRDEFQYEKINPCLVVFRKKIPSQLFELLGVRYQKVATVYSSAVANFDYPIQIDWYGSEISDSLFKRVGHINAPNNHNSN